MTSNLILPPSVVPEEKILLLEIYNDKDKGLVLIPKIDKLQNSKALEDFLFVLYESAKEQRIIETVAHGVLQHLNNLGKKKLEQDEILRTAEMLRREAENRG